MVRPAAAPRARGVTHQGAAAAVPEPEAGPVRARDSSDSERQWHSSYWGRRRGLLGAAARAPVGANAGRSCWVAKTLRPVVTKLSEKSLVSTAFEAGLSFELACTPPPWHRVGPPSSPPPSLSPAAFSPPSFFRLPGKRLVSGAHGEASKDVQHLAPIHCGSPPHAGLVQDSESEAQNCYLTRLRRRWASAAVCETARVRLYRCRFVGARGRPRALSLHLSHPTLPLDHSIPSPLTSRLEGMGKSVMMTRTDGWLL